MANRKRNIQMKFWVTEEEKRLIDEKMSQLPTKQFCPSPSPGCCTAFSNPPASGMESWIFSGSGYSAACPSASIGCASGSCERRLPGRRRRPVCSELRDRRHHRRLRPGVAPAGGGMVCAPHYLPPDRWMLRWTNGREPAGQFQPALLMVSAPK